MTWKLIDFEKIYVIPSRNGLSRPKRVRGSGFKMVNMGELFTYDLINDPPMERVPMSEREQRESALEVGDLLFARQSLVAEGAGKCSIVKGLSELTTWESHLIRVRLDKTKADPFFYYYYFSSSIGHSNIQSLVMQVAAAGIRGSELRKLQIPHPPLKTQQSIARILSAFDDLIENNARRILILEQIAEDLYKEWFIYYRFPGYEGAEFGDSELGSIPKGWEVQLIGDICTYSRGKSYSSSELVEVGGLPFLNLKCIERDGGFRHDGLKRFQGKYKESQTANAGDVIMAVTDMTQERRIIARAARVPETDAETYVLSMDLVKINPKQGVPKDYLYSLFRYSSFADHVKQAANGANVLHLQPDHILAYEFLCPTSEVIEQFSEQVESLYQLQDLLQIKNGKLRQARDLLLPRLISGELDVSKLEIQDEELEAMEV